MGVFVSQDRSKSPKSTGVNKQSAGNMAWLQQNNNQDAPLNNRAQTNSISNIQRVSSTHVQDFEFTENVERSGRMLVNWIAAWLDRSILRLSIRSLSRRESGLKTPNYVYDLFSRDRVRSEGRRRAQSFRIRGLAQCYL